MKKLVYGKLVDGKYVYVKDLGKGRPPKNLVRCEVDENNNITPVGRVVEKAACGIKIVEE